MKKKNPRPFITVKIAQTFDGKIAAVGGRSRWITGRESRNFVHRLRAEHDAVLIGKNTFDLDRPQLNAAGKGGPGWKIVFASPGLLPIRNARIFEGNAQVVFVVEKKDLRRWQSAPSIQNKPCIFLVARKTKNTGYDLNRLLVRLYYLGIRRLLVEGGGEVFWSFLKGRFADRIYWIMAPKILGGRTAKTAVEGPGLQNPNAALNLKIKRVQKLGRDYCFETELE